MFNRAGIKLAANGAFKRQYGISIGALVLYLLLAYGLFTPNIRIDWPPQFFRNAPFFAFLLPIFVSPPVIVGYSLFCIRVFRGETANIGEMFRVGFGSYWRHVGGILWMQFWTLLWTLLFIIPGIVKAIAYSMTPYILAEYPNIGAQEALKISMRMTQGQKGDMFVMWLSFIGWSILSVLTAGILYIVYVGPYMQTSLAGMYLALKDNALRSGAVRAEELA